MTPELLRMILSYHHSAVAEYIAGEPTFCPLCVAFKLNPPPAPISRTDAPMRYHKCLMCGNTFKSIERETVPRAKRSDIIAPSKSPEILAPKRKKRHIKGR